MAFHPSGPNGFARNRNHRSGPSASCAIATCSVVSQSVRISRIVRSRSRLNRVTTPMYSGQSFGSAFENAGRTDAALRRSCRSLASGIHRESGGEECTRRQGSGQLLTPAASRRFSTGGASCRNCATSSCSRRPMSSAGDVAELLAERAHRHDRLGHRTVAAGAADVGEEPPGELAGVLRVAEVPDRDDQRLVDDPGDRAST